ncbi:MAG: DNA-3-methyladenine glycosylase I [Bryobacterales bacterium]|nr:DNA-3-methyladenine glycosylase I [Bryobacterales bacterium]
MDGLFLGEDNLPRCWWCQSTPAYRLYHDTEWGFPVHDDRRLFEKLCLEGFQSGLSWLTILNKREAFRRAFRQFDFAQVAGFGGKDVERLLQDASIVRHRGKIEATINNARRACDMASEFGGLDAYLWRYRPAGRPPEITKEWLMKQSTSPESMALSKDLKKRGWRFVGPTTVYAFMQAMGLVNDHLTGCHVRHKGAL